ncbi:phosphopantetheine-binding protein, partial [Streptomyces sp. NPDC001920]
TQGLPATSIAWGLWQHTSNLTAHLHTTDRERLARNGIVPLGDEEALRLFDAALTRVEPVLVPAGIDVARLRAAAEAGMLLPLFDGLAGGGRGRSALSGRSADGRTTGLADRLSGLAEDEQHALVLDFVRAQVATVLGHSAAGEVETDRGFLDMGFSSLTAVELRNRLNSATGLRLPTTVVFDHATPQALARAVRVGLLPEREGAAHQPVLKELEQLEERLPSIPEEARAALSVRLQDFLLKLNRRDDAEGDGKGTAVTDLIDSASDDEVFRFIDDELGIS